MPGSGAFGEHTVAFPQPVTLDRLRNVEPNSESAEGGGLIDLVREPGVGDVDRPSNDSASTACANVIRTQ